ncbi:MULTISPECIES: hypothetical protein [Elizabethkingia]|uniref:DUF5045 domain-containing protein n=2 Tax=Elizabethkingia anophelis TaxID=1117645 RepID=A0A455ZIZ7_9FLAO|nr:hypothetical protein [Elizabethkingia anophelis]AIL45440.1 hypothetical protein BD94_1665 [Elizabethkingia anophelis NUHP1]MDV4114911.1 hypothetical protein [Elizabethkingia anophelis]DAC76264.1 TPA_exp: hypothetical protein [Elizabethkingia anophelis]DAC76662.1 TPA_exp: hypothetical protein [Elizabethkingia anophelis]
MKYQFRKLIGFSFLFITMGVFAQVSVKRLNDPAIVAQHKRMVFESWGDWRPYPKYFLGIQTNFAYATVWGMWAPNINRDYKDGEDIRPLKPTGVQNQRFAQLKYEEEEAKKIKAASDTIYKRSVQDFAHWTSVTVDADPLWLLYYKRMLKPITEFPDTPQNFMQWRLKDEEAYQVLNTTGTLKRLQEELDLIKEKYAMSRSMDMPRGKRFMMYHETLLRWRKFVQELRKQNNKTTLLLDYKNILKDHSPSALPSGWTPASDKQRAKSVIEQYKHRY